MPRAGATRWSSSWPWLPAGPGRGRVPGGQEWAAAPPELLTRLGGTCREPDIGLAALAEATVRRFLQRIDGYALDTAIGAWLADRARCAKYGQAEAAAPALAVDGKTVRGPV
ncbi:hypothetical protein AB0M92_36730 [Streptomyces sp. NPDC051582]|uniref:hypothetical protein n=1 Tax=Streptomyces sp. NPDC051582 TaxID=3155167 RepID=UPI0034165E3D